LKSTGIRAKVIIFVSCLVVAVMSINAAITIRTERDERKRQLIERGRLFARLTATDIVRTYGSLSPGPAGMGQDIDGRMSRFFGYYPDLTRLSVITEGGMVLYDSGAGGGRAKGMTHSADPELLKRLALKDMDVREFTDPDTGRCIDIIAPVTEGTGPQFIKVRYIVSFRSMEEKLAGIRREFLLLAGFFIALGVAAATVFSKKLTDPILRLKDGAGEIARGNLDYKADVTSKDEIGELGRSFNTMARSLMEHRRDLEEANRSMAAANAELRDLQRELVRSERMAAVGQLAAGLSHEIDNPIGVILGFAELLLEDMPEGDPRRDDLKTIVEESKRCRNIVRGLLDFSRPPVLGVAPTDVGEVVRRTVESAKSQRLFRDVRVGLDISDGVPLIPADPDRLKQVFMNLLLNSVQAMPGGGEIGVALVYERDAGVVRVVFRDTGEGIPSENMEKIFDPFFSTKRPGEGTGLGLAICVRLVEEQGGSITAESVPGKGSVFTVVLPVAGRSDGGERPESA